MKRLSEDGQRFYDTSPIFGIAIYEREGESNSFLMVGNVGSIRHAKIFLRTGDTSGFMVVEPHYMIGTEDN